MRITFLFFFYFILPNLHAQEINKNQVIEYARKVVDTMASKSMYGRGYINKGDSLAANYIKTEFQQFGLKSVGKEWYQHFTFPINTFPDTVSFLINAIDKNNKAINLFTGVAGVNMLVSPTCPSTSGKYALLVFDSTYTVSEKAFNSFKHKIKNSTSTIIMVDDRGVKTKNKLDYFKKVKANYFKVAGIVEFSTKLTWSQSQEVYNYSTIKITDSCKIDFRKFKNTQCHVTIQNKFIPNYQSQNVIGYVEGAVQPDSFIIFSAHYDHLGKMGNAAYFPGANDNASGCAMLLNLAKHYSMSEHKPPYSIAFIAFGAEEVGLVGSEYYTEHPLFPLNNICFLLNMDIMGTGEEGITVVNGSVFQPEFDKLKEINAKNNFIKEVKIRGKAANSDHYYFSEKGVKAFFIYTMGGIKAYHDIYDKAETLPLNEFEDLFKLITLFTTHLQN